MYRFVRDWGNLSTFLRFHYRVCSVSNSSRPVYDKRKKKRGQQIKKLNIYLIWFRSFHSIQFVNVKFIYMYIYIYTWLHFGVVRKNLLLKIMARKWKNSKPSNKLGVTYSVPPTLKEWQLRAVTSVCATMFLTCFFLTWQQ